MIGGLLTGIATSPWMRAALRYGAIALAVFPYDPMTLTCCCC